MVIVLFILGLLFALSLPQGNSKSRKELEAREAHVRVKSMKRIEGKSYFVLSSKSLG